MSNRRSRTRKPTRTYGVSPDSGKPEPVLHVLDWQLVPMAGEILHGRERSRVHPVDVHRAVQVIDLVLQDTRVPALGHDRLRLAILIETLDESTCGPGHQAE